MVIYGGDFIQASTKNMLIIETGASMDFTINHTGISAAIWVKQCHKPLIWEW